MRTNPRLSGRSWHTEAVNPGNGCRRSPMPSVREGDEVDLHVRRRDAVVAAEEGAGIAGADRQRPLAPEGIAHADPESAHQRADLVVDGDRLGAFEDHADLQMVLQILADAGPFRDERYAMLRQQRAGADARKLQQLRRVDGAAGKDHLAPGPDRAEVAGATEFDAD